MAESTLNIYQKLAKIRKPVEVLQKNKAGYGYRYVTEDVILAKITGLMEAMATHHKNFGFDPDELMLLFAIASLIASIITSLYLILIEIILLYTL